MTQQPEPTWLDLYDWRRHVAAMYAEREAALMRGDDELSVLTRFRAQKDALFVRHPQSPIAAPERATFEGLHYFPYDPSLRVQAVIEPYPPILEETYAPTSGPELMPLRRAATVRFTIDARAHTLAVYWIDVYGGGLFLPFRDTTCPTKSYGAGRYLFDTVKGSDFLRLDPSGNLTTFSGVSYAGGPIILDFNYAYNPSCAYDPRWVCPLAPRENHLPIPIRAGELKYHP
jgi:uncharacterized protein (DUF1684 family)